MISIRDGDKRKLEIALRSLESYPTQISTLPSKKLSYVAASIRDVLQSISDLSEPAKYPEPRVVPISDAERRVMYPERFVEVSQ